MSNIYQTKGERIFDIANYIFLVLLCFLFIIPFFVVVSNSLLGQEEYVTRTGFILFPKTIDLSAYKMLLSKDSMVYNAYGVTLMRVVIGTFLNLIFTSAMAYALTKNGLPGKSKITFFIYITMLFQGGLIPLFLLVKSLNITGTFWALVLPHLINPWYMLIMRSFFYEFPVSIEEAAMIDGASPLRILFRIVIPLMKPAFMTIGLFYAVWHWNEFFYASIFINDPKKLPLQTVMKNIILNSSISDMELSVDQKALELPPPVTIKGAVMVISMLPILFSYPYLQKHLVKGVLIGGVKG